MKFGCILFFIFPIALFCQVKRDINTYVSTDLAIGYANSFGKPNEQNISILEFGIAKTTYGGLHGGGASFGFGSEIVLGASKFTIAPKLSTSIYYQFLVLGAELVTYTDFENYSLRFVPFLGIGFHRFKITVNPQLILSNKNFQPVNKGSVNFSINLSLHKKKK